jgi:hypothetical protein
LDDDLMTLDRFVTGFPSGGHFCEILGRELISIATSLSFYAIDDDGSISSSILFNVAISANNMNDHFVSQSNHSVLMTNCDRGCSIAHMASRAYCLKLIITKKFL